MKHASVIVALLSTFVAACRTPSPAPPPQALLACSQLQDPGERVRCYDTQVAQMRAKTMGAAPAAAAVAPPAASPASPTVLPAPVSTSGATASGSAGSAARAAVSTPAATPPAPPVLPAVSAPASTASATVITPQQPASAAQFGEETLPDKVRPQTPQNKRVLLSRIATIDEVRPRVFVISLANGQIWLEEGTQRAQVAIFFRAGDNVRIEKGRFGSYRMSSAQTGAKNWVGVTRVR